MAFVPGFKNDLFVSYAHADNADGWVSAFDQRLRNRLREFDPHAQFSIWRDERLGGSEVFTDEIYEQLKSSALLISILSPNGLTAPWCQQERKRFEQDSAATGGFRIVGNKVRAVKVIKTPTDGDRHRELFGTLGYEFYKATEQIGKYKRFHPASVEFDEEFEELAQELWDLLNRLRKRALSPEPDLTVYVGSVTADLESWRDSIIHQLEAWNCRVVPNAPLPQASPELRAAVDAAQTSKIALSVHFFGETRGFIPEGEDLPVDVLQLERARARGLDRMIFRTSALHGAAEAALENRQYRGREEHLRPDGIDVLLQSLEDRIRALRATSPTTGPRLPTLYVVCEPSEWDAALRLKECIDAHGTHGVLLPIRDVSDESVRRRYHRRDLKKSDAVLVFWGSVATEPWFRDRYLELIGTRRKQRGGRIPALCLGSPPNPDRRNQYSRPDLPFEQVLDLRCDTILPLLRYFPVDGGPA